MQRPKYIEEAIVTALKHSAELNNLCANNVFPLKIPQGVTLPGIVYRRLSSTPDYTFQGYSSESVVVAISCYALEFDVAKEMSLAVRTALNTMNPILQNVIDTNQENTDVFCITAEYLFKQTGGYNYE